MMMRAAPLRRHVPNGLIQQHALRSAVSRSSIYAQTPRRLASTTSGPSARSSWKSFFVRLGLAGGAVYYYNTSPIFGNEPALPPLHPPKPSEDVPQTLDSLAPKRSSSQTTTKQPTTSLAIPSDIPVEESSASTPSSGGSGDSAAALEAEASQQGAFNEETGEINWDCPCLGGMAYGPCGEQFREAFSCFVFSEADPKGMECVDKFKAMQDCFREHPDVYGAELEDDEDEASQQQQQSLPPQATSATTDDSSDHLDSQLKSASEPQDYVAVAKDKLADASDTVKSKAAEVRDAVQERASDVLSSAKEKTQRVKQHADELTREAKSAAADAKDAAAKEAESLRRAAKDKVSKPKDPRTSA